ncbi:MMPL family transporter [Natribaculum luteum]|uniref:MMPL family transporter n=1 Tax=Natribaculum luteum TaxID=1586232 RepID=A0ABD5P2R3_9EURY|nr:MMPL family transporter [Natribaculum luteum]
MGLGERLVGAITRRSLTVIVVMLALSALLGSGVTDLEQASSLDQFETESEEATTLEYADENFGTDDNQTIAQVVVREDDALSKSSLLSTLELQRTLRENETINETLAEDDAFSDLSSVVATVAIQEEQASDLEERREELEADGEDLNATAETLADLLNETQQLQREYEQLNASYRRDEITAFEYDAESDRIEDEFEEIEDDAEAELTDEQAETFSELVSEMRSVTADLAALERGEDVDQSQRVLETRLEEVYGDVQDRVLADEIDDLEERGEQLEADVESLEEGIDPTLDEQIDRLESMNESELEDVLETVLDEDGTGEAYVFLPTSYDSGETSADARTLFVAQETPEAQTVEGEAPEQIVDAQLAMSSILDDRYGDDGFVFGVGIITDEIDRSLEDSIGIVLPLALLFVAVVLTIAYRDVLDIALGLVGIVLVLVWTFGFMGWVGIGFNQIMIAVPVLLVGLSIDYAIHVFMRHREQRETSGPDDGESTRTAMAVALGGLGVALVWVTATAVIGFLSNLVSPVGPIREFGVASAFGIAAALAIFGALIPAMKVQLDDTLEGYGVDRRKRAFGTGGGAVSQLLSAGQRIARRIPWAVVLVSLLLTAGGVYGATQLDTSFEQEDFIADEPADWMASLPEPFAPGNYTAKENLEYVNDEFLRRDTQSQVVVEGDVTGNDTLERVDTAESVAAETDAAAVLASGEADVQSPLSVMDRVADTNESFNETFTDADTDGDGVPDGDLESVYDDLFAADEERAADVIYRTDDGEYEAIRLVVSVRGDAGTDLVTEDTRDVATILDGNGLEATATGQVIVFGIVEDELFRTVIESLLVTLVAVFAFLMVAYRRVHRSALLGAITLLPIVLSVAWILGTMFLLEIPFNVMTGTITSLTVGLGVAYNIHMTERYVLERRRGRTLWDALGRSVTGTGGALLGSAATTVGGFGVLTVAILPPLQQFGLITGLTITYAFLGSVFVLPSFLVLWTRYVGPKGGFKTDRATDETAAGRAYANGEGSREADEDGSTPSDTD